MNHTKSVGSVTPQKSSVVQRSGDRHTAKAKSPGHAKPVHEIRIGRTKATVWANETSTGARHNVTLSRIFKRDGSDKWEQSESFGRDDLPLVIEVCRMAWLWILANSPHTTSSN